MKRIIPFIFAVVLSASPAIAGSEEDDELIRNFVTNADQFGETTAMLRACGYNDKAEANHNTFMEVLTSLFSERQDLASTLTKNYEGGVAKMEAKVAQRGTPPPQVCQPLLD